MGWSNAGWLSDDGGWYKNAVVAAATTTWNPADKNAGITLSNGNLTATNPATSTFISARAIASHSTGKYYYELHSDVQNTFNFPGVGNATGPLSNFAGSDANSVGWVANGNVFINNVAVTGIQTFVQGDTCCIAVDLGNSKIWFRTNGGNWNNDVIANQNPATNTGGISISGLAAGPYFPMLTQHDPLDKNTANFGATAYAQTAPSGFGNW